MHLTTFTDYSLRVLIHVAAQPGRRSTVDEIAQVFDIKRNHLTKVVHFLGRQGWLTTVRGKGGGLELARAPHEVVIGRVVREAEGADRPAECFDRTRNTCPITRICRLKGVLKEATSAFHAVLDGYTLADLVHNQRALSQVLFVPRPPLPAPTLKAIRRA
jgi:Rrf2 family transcriptional regulator, nitric oxide-sensitive transcriptional repressor